MKKWCLLFMLFSSVGFAGIKLTHIELKSEPTGAYLNIVCSSKAAIKSMVLHHPERLVLDLKNTQLARTINTSAMSAGIIRSVRIGQQKDFLRLVLELTQKSEANVGDWHYSQGAYRITFGPAHQKSVSNDPPKPLNIGNSPLRDIVVVIDAGHGGKDPGAHGPRKTKEKDVVLSIAKRLQAHIERTPGMRAVLTRNGDYYIGLRERLMKARRAKADIFVSIHADAFINPQSHGASVFALSPRGATSEAARWLAEKENYSELGGVNLSELDDRDGMVRSVLLDLSQTATISASLQMGQRVLRHLSKLTVLHNQKVEQARFVVLKSPDTPSILVETGFISNPREEANLSNSAFQERLALSIFKGLHQYFYEYPPHGSRFERLDTTKIHVVQKGESLSKIANSYQTSMSQLKSLNHLNAEALRVGQKLYIP